MQVMRPEDRDCCRLIFGEADQLPGLTVDRFGDVLSVQTLSLGMERRKREMLDGLIEVLRERGLPVSCVYERNDVKIRELEGMEEYKGFYRSPLLDPAAEKTLAEITENGIRYEVDVENGQKRDFPRPEIQPSRRGGDRPGTACAGLLHPYRRFRAECGEGRRGIRDGAGYFRGGGGHGGA